MNYVILDTSPLHVNASWVCSLEVVCTLEVLSLTQHCKQVIWTAVVNLVGLFKGQSI